MVPKAVKTQLTDAFCWEILQTILLCRYVFSSISELFNSSWTEETAPKWQCSNDAFMCNECIVFNGFYGHTEMKHGQCNRSQQLQWVGKAVNIWNVLHFYTNLLLNAIWSSSIFFFKKKGTHTVSFNWNHAEKSILYVKHVWKSKWMFRTLTSTIVIPSQKWTPCHSCSDHRNDLFKMLSMPHIKSSHIKKQSCQSDFNNQSQWKRSLIKLALCRIIKDDILSQKILR